MELAFRTKKKNKIKKKKQTDGESERTCQVILVSFFEREPGAGRSPALESVLKGRRTEDGWTTERKKNTPLR